VRHVEGRGALDLQLALGGAHPQLGFDRRAAQEAVDGGGHLVVHGDAVLLLDLDHHAEGRRGAALEHGLLRAAPARLLVGENHRLHAADQVGERRVLQQVLQRVAVGGGDQLHPALGDGARGERLLAGADLVDHHRLRHVVLVASIITACCASGEGRYVWKNDAGWDVAVAAISLEGDDDPAPRSSASTRAARAAAVLSPRCRG
jgi:hypothetical protein